MSKEDQILEINKQQFKEPWCETADVLIKTSQTNDLIHPSMENLFWEKAEDLYNFGYTVINLELREKFTEKLIENFDEFVKSGNIKKNPKYYHYNESPRVVEAWKDISEIKELALNETIMSFLKFCYKRKPIPFSTINFKKGTEQPVHSDYIHFGSIPEKYLAAAWTALEDINQDQGPLILVKKSNKFPIIDFASLGLEIPKNSKEIKRNYEVYETFLKSLITINGLESVSVPMKRGETLIWTANTLHGGAPVTNISKTRYSQVTHYYFSDCKYYTPNFSDRSAGKIAYRDVIDYDISKN